MNDLTNTELLVIFRLAIIAVKLSHLSFLIVLSVQLQAQTDQPLRFERVEGLSQNTVCSIMKDRQRFLWIATADGLSRHDGTEMRIFKPSRVYKKGEFAGSVIRSATTFLPLFFP